jgi:type II secretory pathway pseudopilin PulG
LIELVAVLAIISLLSVAALTNFGSRTVENLSADGFARRLALDLVQARRRTIATGENHYLQLTPSAASPTAYTMYRRTGGSSTQVEPSSLPRRRRWNSISTAPPWRATRRRSSAPTARGRSRRLWQQARCRRR